MKHDLATTSRRKERPMRQLAPPLTDESLASRARLDALLETQRRRGRRVLGWLVGGLLTFPVLLGFLTLLPARPLHAPGAVPGQPAMTQPAAPVPALTPEGKQRPESPAAAETPEPVRSLSNFVVMPGKLVGNFSLGM